MSEVKKITPLQLFFIILQTQIGIGILSLPYNLFRVAETDGWLSLIISGAIVQIVTLIHWGLTYRLPGETVYSMGSTLLGKFFGKLLNWGYVGYYIFTSSTIIVLYVNVLKRWVYHVTPAYVLVLLLAIIAIYFAKEHIVNIARFYVLVSVLLVIIVLLVASAFKYADIRYIFPIGETGIDKIVLGAKEGTISMLGFEAILILAPFVKVKSKTATLKMVMLSNLVVTIIYLYVTLACLLFFSPDEMPLVPEPVLYILKATQNSVIERIDLVFLAFWIISVITSLIMYIYIASVGMKTCFKKKTHRPFVPIIVFCAAALAIYYSKSDELTASLARIITYLVYIFIFIIPTLFFILSLFTKRKGTT